VWCRSNQQAQADLQLLRQEINDFVRSVLANPENRGKSLAARSAAHLFNSVMGTCSVHPGSRILIFTHPGSRISDTGSRIQKQQQKRGVKKICCHTFYCTHKFHIIENYFILEMLKKKIWVNFQRNIELFTLKIVTKLSKIWVWDPQNWYMGQISLNLTYVRLA
jgi:hypothetical protein